MKKEGVYAKKFADLKRRYESARKTFAGQKDDWETQKNRAEAIKKPRTKGVPFWAAEVAAEQQQKTSKNRNN